VVVPIKICSSVMIFLIEVQFFKLIMTKIIFINRCDSARHFAKLIFNKSKKIWYI